MAIKRYSNINFPKWPEFKDALKTLISDEIYQDLVAIHAARILAPDGHMHGKHNMHGSSSGPLGFRRFLPWHRAYLIQFERALRSIDPDLSVPYWDWNADKGKLIGFSGLMGLAETRTLGTGASIQPEPGRVPWFTSPDDFSALTNFGGNYFGFSTELETGPHNRGHVWIGGDMASMASPNDPAFWLHHAQIDRIWSMWQANNPGEKAALSGADAKLDPWDAEFDIHNINDTSDLGDDSYEYVPPTAA
ncbi:tyrosinase family protein [Candidatus Halocynthiibacter alkanivorans]|uniref:tyrosinase family protein n=1 Tax=Candidatus Halocynthiibacter alkanivorans TaxID=2267619 RepID=UPI000DF16D13|nr:tyrosinase family protein [Candidatus Halocynthiibacter alkanivorans]